MSSKLETAAILFALSVLLASAEDFYSFSVKDSDGKLVDLEKYRGQVTFVVNVASECGFTDKHYKGLVSTKKLLQNTDKFEVLAFPCNQFGAQEPKGIADIIKFAQKTYDVNFPIFEKLDVHEVGAADIYKYLSEKTGHSPNWNFWKYLVDHRGEVIGFWGPWTDVEETFPSIRAAVQEAVEADTVARPPATKAQPPPPPQQDDMPRRAPVDSSASKQPSSASKKPSGPPPPPPGGAQGANRAGDGRARSPSSNDPQPPSSAPNKGRTTGKPPSAPAPRHDDL